MKHALLFVAIALYMMELCVLIPIFLLLQIATGRDLSKEWMVDWFYNYVEWFEKNQK